MSLKYSTIYAVPEEGALTLPLCIFTKSRIKYLQFIKSKLVCRCDSDRPCPNVVPVTYDCNEFMVKCGLCQQYTNILKGLKSLQVSFQVYLNV